MSSNAYTRWAQQTFAAEKVAVDNLR
jgi:hypothetical protein